MSKTIGFIDYYISEWHANNYPEWIKNASAELCEDLSVKYVWAEEDVSPVDGATTAEWCEKFGAEQCATIAELCERADFICILAPTNPEKHLAYAREAFKCGKTTYIDKTFAPDYATAREIFDLAEKYGTPFFTTSALRYATELEDFIGAKRVATSGSGSNFDEYIIHQAEMVIKTLDTAPLKVKVETVGEDAYECAVILEGGKEASIAFSPRLPYAIGTDTPDVMIGSQYFKLLIADILRFYLSGTVSFDKAQTLKVMKLREALIKGTCRKGEWIEI